MARKIKSWEASLTKLELILFYNYGVPKKDLVFACQQIEIEYKKYIRYGRLR